MVDPIGIEPTTSCVQGRRSTKWAKGPYFNNNGREDRIRTCDLSVPNRALYQAEPHPDGAPGRTWTHNLLIRSQTIYPIDLQAHFIIKIDSKSLNLINYNLLKVIFTSIFANIINILEEPIGFEPTIKVLQTYALNHLATAPNIIEKI